MDNGWYTSSSAATITTPPLQTLFLGKRLPRAYYSHGNIPGGSQSAMAPGAMTKMGLWGRLG
eukprot:CAMPEP_0172519780 /NCGR_PEP_ID=MMETSP1066-20121228/291617_1 /TAXON_ID=671091 /ORGANISM="Coscinodiscus wailesii, Strain CCMP2513" /LENGTH=61 /DNA_ID=CAMNT_0013302427 /DNA_START=871 /DNA_END=1052 /DNA_ORIENTATION=-